MKTFIIGDIHGCSRPFDALLQRLAPDPAADRLILLGDLFDRGPDSWGVLQTVQKLEKDFGDRFVLIRGNHEDYMVQERLTLNQRLIWERVGRGATVRSFRQHKRKIENYAEWIRDHSVLYYKAEEGPGYFQCVHAGLRIDPPEANDSYTLMHDHMVVWQNEYQGPLTITGHIALEAPSYFAGDGETVQEILEDEWLPLPKQGFVCIDAGCGKGGRLIGMVIEGEQFILYGEAEV